MCLGNSYATTIWQVGDCAENMSHSRLSFTMQRLNYLCLRMREDLPNQLIPLKLSHSWIWYFQLYSVRLIVMCILLTLEDGILSTKSPRALKSTKFQGKWWIWPKFELIFNLFCFCHLFCNLFSVDWTKGMAASVLDRMSKTRLKNKWVEDRYKKTARGDHHIQK